MATWLQSICNVLSLGKKYPKSRLTPSCQLALNNIAQRLLIADQAIKQATQPITNRGYFDVYIEKSTQLRLDHAQHDYYYDRQFSSAARESAKIEHSAEVLHRHMRLLRKSLRTRLKGTAEKLHSIKMQDQLLSTKSGDGSAGPSLASVGCVFVMLDEMFADLIASKEKAKESSTRLEHLRPKTQKQVELSFTQLDLALENLQKDLAPLKEAVKETATVTAEAEPKAQD